jgi:hypothetical protein
MGRTLLDLHRISAHVLGRRRYAVSGHFGLRAGPDGITTPAFGPEPETLRLTSGCLLRELGNECHALSLAGATLAELAAFAGADLAVEFSAGSDMPALGRVDEPLALDAKELDELFAWFALGWRVLDQVAADLPEQCSQTTVQLWPEHFDVGTSFDLGAPGSVNLGFSPGDAFSDEPYAYIGPVPASAAADEFWNAPFGALLPRSRLRDASDGVSFLRSGLDRIA